MRMASHMISKGNADGIIVGAATSHGKEREKPLVTAHKENIPDNQTLDAQIRAVAGNRDKQAFIDLFEYYAPRIKSFFLKGGLSTDVADELAQETMLAIWTKADSFDPAKAALSTWIYTIARNKRIDYFRKTGRPEPDTNDPLMTPHTFTSPDDALSREENIQAVQEVLKELPKEQASIIQQAFFEDKTHAAIAQETGLPLGTVKSRIRLAMERLRHALGGYES